MKAEIEENYNKPLPFIYTEYKNFIARHSLKSIPFTSSLNYDILLYISGTGGEVWRDRGRGLCFSIMVELKKLGLSCRSYSSLWVLARAGVGEGTDSCFQQWLGLCLEVVPRLVLRLSGGKIVLQEGLQVLKGGPLLSIPFPALQHQLVQGDGAILGTRHPVPPLHLLQNLTVVHSWKTQVKRK